MNATKKPPGPHGVRYPWDEWLNGERRELRRGRDFACEPASMGIIVRLAAKRRGTGVTVEVDGTTVTIKPVA